MNLSFLDKTEGVTPLLVKLYDSHKLHGLARDKQPQARSELTNAVTELLDKDLSPRETELIADVLIALMRQAEKDLRQALSERLSVMNSVPLRVALHIANDSIDIAAPVLKNSPVLGDMDLIYIIKSKSAEYWRSIAQRRKLSDQVQNILADTKDFKTAVELSRNLYIEMTDHTLTVLSDIAQGQDELAVPLLRRDEITKDIAAKLYRNAGENLKQMIAQNFGIGSNTAIQAVDEIVLDLEDSATAKEFMPSKATLNAADRFKEKGLLTINMMLGSLKRGQISSFISQFSKFCGLTPETIIEILKQPNGQGLAVACKAFGIEKQDFTSIYLLTNKVRNDDKSAQIKDITKAVQYFDHIRPEVAQSIMYNSRAP
jgi:uncharacterized protein (DUF2336 family)